LPTLLEPLGVKAWRANSAAEATQIIKQAPVHIALVDLSLPLAEDPSSPEEGGPRILQMLSRLDCPPPTVVVQRRKTSRDGDRVLASALSAGVFAVVDRPVHLETVLQTMQRVLKRYYAGGWPAHK
jgi:CheY-like chemotaxis protein